VYRRICLRVVSLTCGRRTHVSVRHWVGTKLLKIKDYNGPSRSFFCIWAPVISILKTFKKSDLQKNENNSKLLPLIGNKRRWLSINFILS
jgi:hypothetical protein